MEDHKDDDLDEDQEEEFRKIHCRMYENKYPKVDDLVIVSQYYNKCFFFQCKIDEIVDYGAYVKLLEYDGIKGMILSGEITRKRVNYVNRLLRKGKEEVLRVLRVDTQKGFIDLSKKTVKPDEVEECKKKYGKSKAVENILKLLCVHTKKPIETLYKQIVWPLYKTHEHAYDAFKLSLSGDLSVYDNLKIDEETKTELMKILRARLVAQPVKIRSDFKITCYTFEGVDAIKEALLNGEKKGTKEIPIKFKIIGSPLYECCVSTIDKNEGIKILNEALVEVEKTIKAKGGNFLVETNPIVLGENEESISDQMKAAKNREEKEEEEEEEEENQEGIQANIEYNNDDDLKIT